MSGTVTPLHNGTKPPAGSVNEFVNSWRCGYKTTHGGHDPHPSLLRRVRAVADEVNEDCGTRRFYWVVAWWAAENAGRDGVPDFVPYLARKPATLDHRAENGGPA